MRVVSNLGSGGAGRLVLSVDYQNPTPTEGKVRVGTTLAGICNIDLKISRGYSRFRGLLGHESAGVVD